MLQEAANGYPTVLSGPIFGSSIAKMFHGSRAVGNFKFMKAANIAELNEMDTPKDSGSGGKVGILAEVH